MNKTKVFCVLISAIIGINLLIAKNIPCLAQSITDNATNEIAITETEYLQGKIKEIIEESEIELEGQTKPQLYQKLKVQITKGVLTGNDVIVENGTTPLAQVIKYQEGDFVMLSFARSIDGFETIYITDYIRTEGILILFIVFILFALLIGAKKGLLSLISMALSFFIIFVFVLPQIQAGEDPVGTAIIASIFIIPITFYMSHGFEKKTTVAMAGSLIALIITGIASNLFVNLTHLTGLATEEAIFLQMSNNIDYNLKGLLLAGIIIGTLGVMDDITISQTSIVYQLYDLKKELTFIELYKRSIQIGKDHIASMINTLFLVYAGASMPLLLLFMNNPRPFEEILSSEIITTEIVRTLVGSIGLILAVPITTYLACYFVKKSNKGNLI